MPKEIDFKKVEDRLQRLEQHMEQLRATLAELQQHIAITAKRYIATCPGCHTDFDLLAHHYSIGLFDNLVYVKCPQCHKTLPIEGGGGGRIRIIEK